MSLPQIFPGARVNIYLKADRYFAALFFSLWLEASLRCANTSRLQHFLLQRSLDVHSAQPILPQEMPSDVKETFCHSFSFAVVTEQQAGIDEHYSSCAHTFEGPLEWPPR